MSREPCPDPDGAVDPDFLTAAFCAGEKAFTLFSATVAKVHQLDGSAPPEPTIAQLAKRCQTNAQLRKAKPLLAAHLSRSPSPSALSRRLYRLCLEVDLPRRCRGTGDMTEDLLGVNWREAGAEHFALALSSSTVQVCVRACIPFCYKHSILAAADQREFVAALSQRGVGDVLVSLLLDDAKLREAAGWDASQDQRIDTEYCHEEAGYRVLLMLALVPFLSNKRAVLTVARSGLVERMIMVFRLKFDSADTFDQDFELSCSALDCLAGLSRYTVYLKLLVSDDAVLDRLFNFLSIGTVSERKDPKPGAQALFLNILRHKLPGEVATLWEAGGGMIARDYVVQGLLGADVYTGIVAAVCFAEMLQASRGAYACDEEFLIALLALALTPSGQGDDRLQSGAARCLLHVSQAPAFPSWLVIAPFDASTVASNPKAQQDLVASLRGWGRIICIEDSDIGVRTLLVKSCVELYRARVSQRLVALAKEGPHEDTPSSPNDPPDLVAACDMAATVAAAMETKSRMKVERAIEEGVALLKETMPSGVPVVSRGRGVLEHQLNVARKALLVMEAELSAAQLRQAQDAEQLLHSLQCHRAEERARRAVRRLAKATADHTVHGRDELESAEQQARKQSQFSSSLSSEKYFALAARRKLYGKIPAKL